MRISCTRLDHDIHLVSASFHDCINALYQVDALVTVMSTAVTEADLIGQRFCLSIDQALRHRLIWGVCTSAYSSDTTRRSRSFRVRLHPWAWHLTRTIDSRVFQNLTCFGIAREVFSKYNFTLLDDLTRDLPNIEFRVQYEESDFAFVCRTLEEYGVYFYFRHTEDGEVLVFCNDASAHRPIEGFETIQFLQTDGAVGRQGEYIDTFESHQQVVPTELTASDTNFAQYNQITMARRRSVDVQGFSEPMAVFQHQNTDEANTEVEARARQGMERIIAGQHVLGGTCNVRHLKVGDRFTLAEHNVDDFNQEYVVTSCFCNITADADEAGGGSEYHCRFEVIPAQRQYRPARATPAPRINSIMTAIVTGPNGSEIHTDEYGRVKVQFHWDRYGAGDQTSSCWVRVATPWAGRGWGSVAIPRVGQEVVVQFENGNPDRPIVTGMLYNAQNMPAYPLPANATQSGLRSSSSPGGGGANEIQFEDKAGAEEFNVTAERDYALTVKNDAYIDVGYEKGAPGNYTLNVHQHRTESVSNGNLSVNVDTGNRTSFVNANDSLEVNGNRSELIAGTLGSEAAHITMNGTTDLKAESPEITINGTSKTTVGSAEVEVDGRTIKMTGAQEISLSVGGSSIVLNATGVTIVGPLVKIN